MPSRRLHLPRLTASARRRLLIAAGVLLPALGLAGDEGFGAPEAPDGAAYVALFLFGQSDPRAVVAAGRHGLGGQPVRLAIAPLSRCRYAVTAGGWTETLDFAEVAGIRHVLMDDPAAEVAHLFGPTSTDPAPAKRAVAILSGREDAICDGPNCTDRRAYGLVAADRLAAARDAAAAFQRTLCPAHADVATAQRPEPGR
jgi:hypothetical protein